MVARILATADIHSPKYFPRFRETVKNLGKFDAVLIAGDLTESGSVDGLKILINELRRLSDTIIAVPGNEDYDEVMPRARELGVVRWLDDEVIKLTINDVTLRIIGSKGSLERPTTWQLRHISNIADTYRRRVEWLRRTINSSRELTILLIHYAPTFKTLQGEDPRIWPSLGVRDLEGVIFSNNVIAIHGHAHNSTVRCIKSGSSYIVNAAFTNIWKPVILEVGNEGLRSISVSCQEVKHEKGGGPSILDFMK
ncbi:metallophosphoesterase family protein [Vulcanisaeta souniana]|uniref:Metallophosphoesterase n=1 Tax=Vulcanisaeta souniana JCM 11219 TaxID=1293586 RepID=A0A830EEN3_9CREN|nr:metallophosphoesterase [Vulcanisaeta souniana]BDR91912.1 metallophosphoesterase [Vulcanisaeta souniana JCM 11219]GGI69440.1 metallophosphoesterase [Vulcanisaeta souniana JCM 11219]